MKGIACSVIFVGLCAIDYVIGNGFVDMFQMIFSRVSAFMETAYQEEAKKVQINAGVENPIILPVFLTEIILLSLTLAFFKSFKRFRSVDRITQLLQESKVEINNANEILEKWRLRKVPNDCSYLDDEPQKIQPLKLEMPLLHMAVIDTLGPTRSQPVRSDAGDIYKVTGSNLLSISSLLDEDFESIPEKRDSAEKIDQRFEYNKSFLWDVTEEDLSVDKE